MATVMADSEVAVALVTVMDTQAQASSAMVVVATAVEEIAGTAIAAE